MMGYMSSAAIDHRPDTATTAPGPVSSQPSDAQRLAALRAALGPYRKPSSTIALGLFAGDVTLFAVGQALVVLGPGTGFRLLGALLSWVAIVRLFLLGHDACHGAFTGSSRLNKVLGRLAFLPSLTPFSLWHVGHNVVHHGFNNLRGRDFVWEPKSPEDYLALSPGRQRMERIYRGAAGPGLYYLWEIWWQRLYFPGLRKLHAKRLEFKADCWLVTVFAALWIGGLVLAAPLVGAPAWLLVTLGFVLPFLAWNWTMGLVIYLHHTAPDIRWFNTRREWLQETAQASGTQHLTMPGVMESLLHHIMAHPAHHLDATIPLYRLEAAQRRLLELMPELKAVPLTFAYYRDCIRTCKVYDYAAGCWRPFPEAAAASR